MLHSIDTNNTRMEVEPSILETEQLISSTKQMLVRVDALLVKLRNEADHPKAAPPLLGP